MLNVNRLTELARSSTYWKSYRDRLWNQFYNVHTSTIVPATYLVGTLSARQSEKTWLTISSPKQNRIGSEVYSLVQAPPGFLMVGADFDQMEVRIAALLGDARYGRGLGATPMSQSALNGSKKLGTDPHSLTARLGNCDRRLAKIANFRIQYGGGKYTVTMGIKQSNLDLSMEQCELKAEEILLSKKGRKERGLFVGGSDSEFHNYAVEFAATRNARLPLSGRLIGDGANLAYDTNKDWHTTRVNYIVQSSGSDLRHLTQVAIAAFARRAGITYRHVICRHDELWFYVEESRAKEFAKIMNKAHALTWAAFLESIGIYHLPKALLGFSSVNIDHCLRKEVDAPTVTCSGGVSYPDGEAFEPGDLV